MIDRIDVTPVIHVLVAESCRFEQVQAVLAEQGGLQTSPLASIQELVESYRVGQPGCLLVDFCLPIIGPGFFDQLDAQAIDLPVIILASSASISDCATAMRSGAFDFVEIAALESRLLESVRTAVQQQAAQHERRVRRVAIIARMQQLTGRERETMDLVLEGLSTKQIASRFGIRFQTAAKHHARLLHKMAVRNDVQLVRLCLANDVPARSLQSPLVGC